MRILFTIGGFGRGGKERRMLSLLEFLAGQGHELAIVASHDSPQLSAAAPFCQRVYDYRVGSFLRNLREHARAVSEFRPDLIHSWSRSCTLCAILAAAGRRSRVVTSEITNARAVALASEEFWTTRFNFAFSARVLSNSRAGLEAKRAPSGKATVIHNGYRLGRLREVDPVRFAHLRRADALTAVMAARFSREKDYTTVVQTARLCAEAGLPVQFVLAGEGPDLPRMKAEARRLPNVAFAGYVDEIDDLLHHMDVGILATDPRHHQEGISNSIVEYMAHGLPVLATDGLAVGEILSHGTNGYITRERDPRDLFEKLRLLQADRRLLLELGASAKQTVEERFNLERMGGEFLKVYAEVAGRPCETSLEVTLQKSR